MESVANVTEVVEPVEPVIDASKRYLDPVQLTDQSNAYENGEDEVEGDVEDEIRSDFTAWLEEQDEHDDDYEESDDDYEEGDDDYEGENHECSAEDQCDPVPPEPSRVETRVESTRPSHVPTNIRHRKKLNPTISWVKQIRYGTKPKKGCWEAECDEFEERWFPNDLPFLLRKGLALSQSFSKRPGFEKFRVTFYFDMVKRSIVVMVDPRITKTGHSVVPSGAGGASRYRGAMAVVPPSRPFTPFPRYKHSVVQTPSGLVYVADTPRGAVRLENVPIGVPVRVTTMQGMFYMIQTPTRIINLGPVPSDGQIYPCISTYATC
jgi:hypothetical protein